MRTIPQAHPLRTVVAAVAAFGATAVLAAPVAKAFDIDQANDISQLLDGTAGLTIGTAVPAHGPNPLSTAWAASGDTLPVIPAVTEIAGPVAEVGFAPQAGLPALPGSQPPVAPQLPTPLTAAPSPPTPTETDFLAGLVPDVPTAAPAQPVDAPLPHAFPAGPAGLIGSLDFDVSPEAAVVGPLSAPPNPELLAQMQPSTLQEAARRMQDGAPAACTRRTTISSHQTGCVRHLDNRIPAATEWMNRAAAERGITQPPQGQHGYQEARQRFFDELPGVLFGVELDQWAEFELERSGYQAPTLRNLLDRLFNPDR